MVDKRCPRCQTVKPADQFGPDKTKRDGLLSRCRDCEAASARERRRRRASPETTQDGPHEPPPVAVEVIEEDPREIAARAARAREAASLRALANSDVGWEPLGRFW
jgi:hypothetical protein